MLLIRKVVPSTGPLNHCWAGGPSAGHSFDPPAVPLCQVWRWARGIRPQTEQGSREEASAGQVEGLGWGRAPNNKQQCGWNNDGGGTGGWTASSFPQVRQPVQDCPEGTLSLLQG